jgi:hypothetical protein
MPSVTIEIEKAGELEEYLRERLVFIAENHNGLTHWTLGDYIDAVVVSKEYRGEWQKQRELEGVLEDFGEKLIGAIVGELLDYDDE